MAGFFWTYIIVASVVVGVGMVVAGAALARGGYSKD